MSAGDYIYRMSRLTTKYSRSVAINMVIANMIGTGIFTSLGFQVMDGGIPDAFTILVIWIVGGIIALCGATSYGEVATYYKRSGGEYTFLSDLYHPSIGFVSGWISLIVGFSAAIASLALATGEYFLPLTGLDPDTTFTIGVAEVSVKTLIALIVILIVVLIQLNGVRSGGVFQNLMTYLKLGLIVFFLLTPLIFSGNYTPTEISYAPSENSWDMIFSLPFAGALVWVMYSYSGWNASTYIAGNLKDPRRNLPQSLFIGTLAVSILYVLLNITFLNAASFDDLAGQLDIANIVARKVMGDNLSLLFSAVFSIALISGVNAMFIAGPRVAEQIGKDYSGLELLGRESSRGVPSYAIIFLMLISAFLVIFSSFKEIIEYIGVTLSIFSFLTVAGVFIIRRRNHSDKDVVKTWGYPLTPLIFIGFTIWMVVYFVLQDPLTLVYSLLTMVTGFIVYFALKKSDQV